MTKYQKIFIIISAVFVLPFGVLFLKSLFGGIRANPYFFVFLMFVMIHWLLYFLYSKSRHSNKLIIFLPAIFFLLISIFLTFIVIKNYGIQCDETDPGCMNEDFSGVFLMFSLLTCFLSFGYSLLFKFLWFKKDKQINI